MDQKSEFIVSELWILAWRASVQRANLYKKDIDKSITDKFRKKIINYLSSDIMREYKDGVTEDRHYINIEKLIKFGNENNHGILSLAGYKYGVAQKLLNLVLKYHWCLSLIKEPPHCPVDRLVIDKTKFKGKINWTHITQRSEYQKVIEEIKCIAQKGNLSIPFWELKEFSRRKASLMS